jgi:glycerol-3-phosphate dehydrogenase (NAD(P)+)
VRTETPVTSLAVIGAGSWGTALAIQFARAGQPTVLWGRTEDNPEQMDRVRCNTRYLPESRFPDELQVDGDLQHVVNTNTDILICVPSHAFRIVLEQVRPYLDKSKRISWATKGFEQQSGKLPHQVALEVLGEGYPLAVLSGPTFATEVGAGLPTAITVASPKPEFAGQLAERISNAQCRAYTSDDIIGVEVGGAVKNVLAIAAGMSDGLGYGANARIALISRGLNEMTRLGVALGAKAETFMGLSGMGDLVLTCTDDQSRNRRMGLALASGRSAAEVAEEIGQVVEGVYAAQAVHTVATREGVDMPICEQVYRILYENASATDVVDKLMSRALKPETESQFCP